MNEEQNKYQLPKDWKWEVSSNILDIRDGTHDTPKYVNKIGIPLITSKNLKENKIDFEKVSYISNEDHAEISKRSKVEAGDILFAMIGTIGNPAIIKGDANFSIKNVGLFKKNEHVILPSFLVNFLRSHTFEKQMNERKLLKGTTQKFIPLGNLRNINIPLPPKPTQLAIVSKIEELFSELDKGIENLHTAQQQLKTYRQSVLKWAFVNENFKDFILKDITDKIQIGPFGTQLHKEDYIENGIPLINPTHIKGGFIQADTSFSILKSKRDSLPNYILREGDVIMGRRGEMGRCGLVTRKEAGWFCGTGSLYFRPDVKKVNPVFLYYNLSSQSVKKYLDNNAGGTIMANLNLKIVNDIPISLPSIEEQNTIVKEIESRLSVADKMEESITQSMQKAEALRQSILKKAFEGKLIQIKKY